MSRCKPIYESNENTSAGEQSKPPENPKSSLEQFLCAGRKNGISAKELGEYAQVQRDRVDQMNCEFGLKQNETFYTGYFVPVHIECVTSSHEFYAIPVRDLEQRNMFQNELNWTYEIFFEPFNAPKVKDFCIVRDRTNWCRGQIVEIDAMEKFTVHLFDYGRTIEVEKYDLSIMREPHNMTRPFEMKCQLSILTNDESELTTKRKDKLMKKFDQLSTNGKEFLVYVDGQFANSINDVLLFTDCENNANTVYGAYALHEVYGAFIRPKIQFHHELCEKWCKSVHLMAKEVDADLESAKKVRVWMSHIASPNEIYVKCGAAEKRMSIIRRIVDNYVDSIGVQNNITASWSIDDDCLVRAQNWNTKTSLKLWYRGRIIGIDTKKGTFNVFLRDYGRKIEVTHSDLMAISPTLAKPGNAIQKCSLSISMEWLESNTNHLQNFVDEYKFFAITCKSKNETDMSIVLYATNSSPDVDDGIWDDIGFAVVCASVRESMESFINKSQRAYVTSKYARNDNSNDESFISKIPLEDPSPTLQVLQLGNTENKMNLMARGEIVSKWPRRMSIDRKAFVGTVTCITDKGVIYIQEVSNAETAAEVTHGINDLMKISQPNTKNHEWNEGDACFVEFEFGSYYRARVLKISREDATCLIQYVDYGDKVLKHLEDLHVATNYGDIPVLAHKLFVSKLQPNAKTGQWIPHILDEFKLQLLLKTCDVRIDDTIDDHNELKIMPCSIEPLELPCNIFNWLCTKKFGVKDIDRNNEEILIVG